ncbi:hypothetical protein BDE02_13G044200 [Populus trichocarpa]|nr:hypothetical protein BDE02_13G044200 [Populus trichocarpa]
MKAVDMFTQSGSVIASVMFIWAMFKQYCPYQLQNYFEKHSKRVFTFVYPFIQITFNEFTGDRFMRSEAYSAIENYLGSSSSMQAKRLKADVVKNSTQSLVLSMDDFEEVTDEFQGVKLRGSGNIADHHFFYQHDERMYYTLTFHKRHRNLILGTYLSHVLKEGDAIKVKNRQRKLYTNSGSYWRHVVFEHPASFESIAMEADKKKEIMDDLITFSQAEEFYARIGRAWKRGYLLYGPQGLLRKLLIETSSKSVIVIEDIDCSLDLTGQRKKKKEEQGRGDEKDPKLKLPKEETDSKQSQVTLSGLLNFIDGLWSACKGERLVVFTTNFLEKLDPALIRKGRMDKHIELSYCSFEAFKVLAKNYLRLETHHLYSKIQELLGETKMTPAEVAEHLMPKTLPGDNKVCLEGLIAGLEKAKEDARLKAEEEAREKDSSPEEKAKEKDSSPEENAKEQGKENGFCDNGNTETNYQ